jgi:sulfate adenylyltransferase subunit 1 (EFTu-like GTPase family)
MHKALGTIASIDGQHVVVTTTDGKSVTVMLDKETTITRGNNKLDASALKVGERLSVDYMEEKGMMMAHAFKLSTTSTPTQAKK